MQPKTLIRILLGLLVVLVLAMTCRFALASQVTLQWDANIPTPSGYRVFKRLDNTAYDYTTPVWDGTETTATITDLDPGIQYYFVVRAYVNENESGNSNEVNFTADVNPPQNLRINLEISVFIDVNGKPVVAYSRLQNDQGKGAVPMK